MTEGKLCLRNIHGISGVPCVTAGGIAEAVESLVKTPRVQEYLPQRVLCRRVGAAARLNFAHDFLGLTRPLLLHVESGECEAWLHRPWIRCTHLLEHLLG